MVQFALSKLARFVSADDGSYAEFMFADVQLWVL